MIAVLSWLRGLCHLLLWLGWCDSQVRPGAAEIKQLWLGWTEECHSQGNWQSGEGDVAIKTIFCHLECQMPDLINRENCRSTEFFAFSATWKPLMCPNGFLRLPSDCLEMPLGCVWKFPFSEVNKRCFSDPVLTVIFLSFSKKSFLGVGPH